MELPQSMDECLYFTNRKLEDGTCIIAFVRRKECPACHKGQMGKPVNEKTGRPKTRSQVYVCPACGHEEEKKAHEESCMLEIEYTDPEGKQRKQTSVPYKRRTWKGVPSFVFHDEFTDTDVGITKKLKKSKSK